MSILVLPLAVAGERPDLTHRRVSSPFGGNGHTSTLDGRIFIANVGEDHEALLTRWKLRVFRPEALAYSSEGIPDFSAAFSSGQVIEVGGGENALALCYPDPAAPYRMEGAEAVYDLYLFDSKMFGGGVDSNMFRRRSLSIRVRDPFTTQAEIVGVEHSATTLIRTTAGVPPLGIEPTMTADGRLMIFQGAPSNTGAIDHLMYTVAPSPCALEGWSVPRPLSDMAADPLAAPWPIAHGPLLAADGAAYEGRVNPLRGAYPWVDPEGRDVFFASVPFPAPVGGRREAVAVVGADTGHTVYHVDGGVNASRNQMPKLFYSGPMWQLERERAPSQTLPVGGSQEDHYLPVTKIHDVVPLFGSNTSDYNEIDLGELMDPALRLALPMNELVTRGGEYDLGRSPDTSGGFHTARLFGDAQISEDNALNLGSGGSVWTPHGRGRALLLGGSGGAVVPMDGEAGVLAGFTLQLALRPGEALSAGEVPLLAQPGSFKLTVSAAGAHLLLKEGRGWRALPAVGPLPEGRWTHVAFTWDGEDGQVRAYVNGLPQGLGAAGPPTLSLTAGPILVGGGREGGGFVGAVDEVRIYDRVRAARNICMHAFGSDCMDAAIQEPPPAGQGRVSLQAPACASPSDLGGLPCQQAMHRLCATLGVDLALESATNAWETALQLISERPPVPMAGVPLGGDAASLTVACAPIAGEPLAVTHATLSRYHEGCLGPDQTTEGPCVAAAHRFCVGVGWTTGQIFEETSRPWVACFDSAAIVTRDGDAVGAACAPGQDPHGGACQVAVAGHCRGMGYDGGLVQEVGAGQQLEIHCFDASTVATWPF